MAVIARIITAQAKRELVRLNLFMASMFRLVNSPNGTLFVWSRMSQSTKCSLLCFLGCLSGSSVEFFIIMAHHRSSSF